VLSNQSQLFYIVYIYRSFSLYVRQDFQCQLLHSRDVYQHTSGLVRLSGNESKHGSEPHGDLVDPDAPLNPAKDKSLLIIRFENVMIIKLWYVKNQIHSFVHQENQLVRRTPYLLHQKKQSQHRAKKTRHTQRKPDRRTCAFSFFDLLSSADGPVCKPLRQKKPIRSLCYLQGMPPPSKVK
jgi:hypothetical protein